jgi:hypothetical protein
MYQLQPEVYWVENDGCSRLLDLERGRFYALDAVAGDLLNLVLGHGVDGAVRRAAAAYTVGEDVIRNDLQVLLNDLAAARLVTTPDAGSNPLAAKSCWRAALCRLATPAARPAPAGALPTARQVSRLLKRAWLCLRLGGWLETVTRWGNTVAPLERSPSAAELHSLHQLVCAAASRQALVAVACKERALVGYHLARQRGWPAELVVGIQHYPFLAHAWVEVAGRVLTDEPGHCSLFAPVARYR